MIVDYVIGLMAGETENAGIAKSLHVITPSQMDDFSVKERVKEFRFARAVGLHDGRAGLNDKVAMEGRLDRDLARAYFRARLEGWLEANPSGMPSKEMQLSAMHGERTEE